MVMSTPNPTEPTGPKRIRPRLAFWLFVVVMVALWIAAVYFVWWHPRGPLFNLPLIIDQWVK